MTLTLVDRIYGRHVLKSPVLIDLLKSAPIQRLKRICQFGVPDKYYHLRNFTRYEHSVGVMLLLRKLGASEEEQIAGLLHDVSHTAFSHVIDWVVGYSGHEDFQDNKHTEYIKNSEIAQILCRHSFDLERISNSDNFGLLEREIPTLCADRIDYALREFPIQKARQLFLDLKTTDVYIVFQDQESASVFAHLFLSKQMNHWGGIEAVTRFYYFAEILREAVDLKILKFEDFWSDDNTVIEKVEKSGRFELKLNVLKHKALRIKKPSGLIRKKNFDTLTHFLLKVILLPN